MKPDIQPLPEMPEYPLVEIERLRLQVESLSRLAAMLASAVKCGEEWTDTLEREYRAAIPSASGGDEACKTRTVHGCWCDLPNGHDGPHRSYDDPEPEPASGGDEARCPTCLQMFDAYQKGIQDGTIKASGDEARCAFCGGQGWAIQPDNQCPSCKGSGKVGGDEARCERCLQMPDAYQKGYEDGASGTGKGGAR